jgi:LuxR family maltose regulon positive regulatory protein
LAAGDTAAAFEVVSQHRYTMMNTTQWPRLERWLNLFSTEVVETSAELWMLKTWLVYHRGQWSELPALLGHLAAIFTGESNQETANRLAGEISSLRSLIAYHSGDAEGAISQARRALDTLPPELWIVRVLARTHLGGSLLMRGDVNGGYHAYYGAFEEEKVQNKRFKATLLMTACNFHWITADLQSMAQAAKQSIALCQETNHREIFGYGNYQLGRVRYQQNNLPAAEELFASVVARPYQNYGLSYTNSACGLGMTTQALGREVEAREVTEAAIAFLLETGNTTQLPVILALQAEVALVQGRLPAASQWAEKLDPVPPLVPMFGFLAPHLTLVKVWLASNTPASQSKASELLSQLQEYLKGIHNTRFLIETLALQATLEQAFGDRSATLVALEKSLGLAQPGGFIRLFVDLGPPKDDALEEIGLYRPKP